MAGGVRAGGHACQGVPDLHAKPSQLRKESMRLEPQRVPIQSSLEVTFCCWIFWSSRSEASHANIANFV